MRLLQLLQTLVALTVLISPVQPVHSAESACQFVIGSCHRPPLSNPASTGIIDRLTIEAFKRIGYSACIAQLPCERSLLNADSGVSDGDILRIPAAIAGKYPNLVAVPEPTYSIPMVGFTTRAGLQPRGIADLAPLRVGYVLGWRILEDQVRAAEVLRVRGAEELFALLADNKADIVIYERLTGLYLVRTMGASNVRVIEPPLLSTAQHLVINQRHRQLAEPLAAAIRALKADGTFAAIFREAGFPVPDMK